MFKAEAVTDLHRERDLDDQVVALRAHDPPQHCAAIVRLIPGYVVPSRPAAIHPARESPGEDLHQRLDLPRRRRLPSPSRQPVEELPIAAGHGGDVFWLLLAAFHLEAPDAGVRDLRQVIPCAKISSGDQVPAVQLGAGHGVG